MLETAVSSSLDLSDLNFPMQAEQRGIRLDALLAVQTHFMAAVGSLLLVLHPLEMPDTCEQTSLHSSGKLSTLMVVSAMATAARPERIDSLVKSILAFRLFDRECFWCSVVSGMGVKSGC